MFFVFKNRKQFLKIGIKHAFYFYFFGIKMVQHIVNKNRYETNYESLILFFVIKLMKFEILVIILDRICLNFNFLIHI